ncbi:MAG: endonuclease III domain-containing protein [Candidatus Caldipriscus sp.]
MDLKEKVYWAFLKLLCAFGRQNWWPRIWNISSVEDEVILGAVLTQNVSWKNVERVLENLKRMGIRGLEDLLKFEDEVLEELLKPTAFVKRKIKTIRGIFGFLRSGNLSREELLKVYGVGEETEVIDEYTLRWFGRFFGFLPKKGEIREILHFEDLFYLREMHALIDELGKRFCKKEPLCKNCPLRVKCSFARK